MQTQGEVKGSFRILMWASALTVALWFLPFGNFITYPIRIFVTLVHEGGHALAAIATGGSVGRVMLDWGGSGVTETRGGLSVLIASAGYLTTTIFGAALLLFLRRPRNSRATSFITAGLLLCLTVFFAGNVAAWLTGLALGAALLILAVKGATGVTHLVMSFLGVQSVLNAFYDLRTLIYLSAFQPGRPTDAQNMTAATGGFVPAVVWAVGWSVLSMVILAVTLIAYYRSLEPRRTLGEIPVAGMLKGSFTSATHRDI
jgi:hypothetical protein